MEAVPVDISVYRTPHPSTLKYLLSRDGIVDCSEYFRSLDEARERSPLATRFFGCPGVEAVMLGPGFVSVTFDSQDDLIEKNNHVMEAFKAHLESGDEVCRPRDPAELANEDEVSKTLRQTIETEIRPKLEMDGGSIAFLRYEEGIAYVMLQGACGCCPHATMTLKSVVEARLKELVPELQEVVSLA